MTRMSVVPPRTVSLTSSSPMTHATRYVDIFMVGAKSNRVRPSSRSVRAVSAPFDTAVRPASHVRLISKVALNSGSSQQGNARRAYGASNWVTAMYSVRPSTVNDER